MYAETSWKRARVRGRLTESEQLQLTGGGAVTTSSVEPRLGRSQRDSSLI